MLAPIQSRSFCLLICCINKIGIYKTIILPVVLYRCETWPLMLREEHRVRMFANRVLRTIFGPKRDEVTGNWRKLCNEELCNFSSSPSVIRKDTQLGRLRKARNNNHNIRAHLGRVRVHYSNNN
jgi:hypothetical protein